MVCLLGMSTTRMCRLTFEISGGPGTLHARRKTAFGPSALD
jgi:hypothetical protein